MRIFTGKKNCCSDCHVLHHIHSGVHMDAGGLINDVLDSFTLLCSAVFTCLEVSFRPYPAMEDNTDRLGEQGHAKGRTVAHWAGMSALHCWPQSWCHRK